MPRPRSAHVHEVKAALLSRLGSAVHRPGERFLSTRAVAAKYQISYQTAHRLLQELVQEKHLHRKAASGTYFSDEQPPLKGVQLWFAERAELPGSFGNFLLQQLRDRLRELGTTHVVTFGTGGSLKAGMLPVIWEVPPAINGLVSAKRFGLLLNEEPPPGLAGNYIDSISVDDFSGGAVAAELFVRKGIRGRPLIFAGPRSDHRSCKRVAGFQSLFPRAQILHAAGWHFEHGLKLAPRAFNFHPPAVFACNDRLAEAMLVFGCQSNKELPPIIGFDDAPAAERLDLTTVAIPWADLVERAVEIMKMRLTGSSANARKQVLSPFPVVRAT